MEKVLPQSTRDKCQKRQRNKERNMYVCSLICNTTTKAKFSESQGPG